MDAAGTGAGQVPILPLGGILVLDFSQFLAGPVAAMRLSDLGARVIKIERPGIGDIGRTLAFAGKFLDGDTLSFQIMNRGKESYAADLSMPIFEEFGRLADAEAGRVRAKVVSATRLRDDQRERLRRALAARTGKQVELEEGVDPSLLGGAVASVAGVVFDGSLRTQLAQLHGSLTKRH